MGNSRTKYEELLESGSLPEFDPTNYMNVLSLARTKGFRQQVMYTAMDMVREDATLTNEQAILKSAKSWKII